MNGVPAVQWIGSPAPSEESLFNMATKKSATKKSASKVRSGTAKNKPAAKRQVASTKKSAGSRRSKTVKPAPKRDVERQRKALLELRDRVTGQISFLSDDAAHKDDIPPEDRTDEFDREFALSLVSTEQDALYEIDEALRRIDHGQYGVCESCAGTIENNRLRALPFARHCLGCQAGIENGTLSTDQEGHNDLSGHRFNTVESPKSD